MKPKLVQLEDVTLERMLAARAIRASDGCISQLLWENSDSEAAGDLFIRVREVAPTHVDLVRQRVCQLLIDSERGHSAAETASRARGSRARVPMLTRS